MVDSNGVSARMSAIIAAVMPKIAVTVANITSTATPKIDLATAENWLVRDELVTLFMEAVAKNLDFKTLSYPQGFGGDPTLLSALASFFNTYFRSAIPVHPSHIAVVGGASSCLDQLMYTICDAGDSVLVPAPYWNGFDFHLTLRTGVTILPVSTPTLRSTVSASLIPALDTAYNTARDPAGIKALLFTNPHNPLGQCYTKAVITEALCWCGRKGIHFIGNEVYGLSEFRRGKEDEGFVSTLSLVAGKGEGKGEEEKSDAASDPARSSDNSNEIGRFDAYGVTPTTGSGENRQELQEINGRAMETDIDLSRVHTIWSMSKDLGCSGLRIATLVSQNNTPLLTSIRLLAAPLLTSPTTLLATALFSSEKLHTIIKLSRVRLARAYAIVEAQLRRWGVDFIEARAGVFVWARLLSASTVGPTGADKGNGRVVENGNVDGEVDGHAPPAVNDWEAQLVQRIHDCGVLVSPGQAYHVGASPEDKGWVRITLAVEEGQLREGLRKIGECLGLGKRKRAVGEDQIGGEEANQVREESRVDMEDQMGGDGLSQVEKDGNVNTADQLGGEEEIPVWKDGRAETN